MLDWRSEQLWKWQLSVSISALVSALGLGPDRAAAEKAWDNDQRQLHFKTALDAGNKDPARSAAANRVRDALLLGEGTAQTQLPLQEEVDFGLKQIALSSASPLSDDCALLGLAPYLDNIRTSTLNLSRALGNPSALLSNNPSPSNTSGLKRRRRALEVCHHACDHIYSQILWLMDHLPSPTDRDRLSALALPLAKLLADYPRPPKTPKPTPIP